MPPSKHKLPARPLCFVSYSTREPHVQLLLQSARILFSPHYDIRITPSALEAGASQRDRITELIKRCAFAIVALDGLRPKVVWEYGMLHALEKPVILLKEAEAQVDIASLFSDAASLDVKAPTINLDSHFTHQPFRIRQVPIPEEGL